MVQMAHRPQEGRREMAHKWLKWLMDQGAASSKVNEEKDAETELDPLLGGGVTSCRISLPKLEKASLYKAVEQISIIVRDVPLQRSLPPIYHPGPDRFTVAEKEKFGDKNHSHVDEVPSRNAVPA